MSISFNDVDPLHGRARMTYDSTLEAIIQSVCVCSVHCADLLLLFSVEIWSAERMLLREEEQRERTADAGSFSHARREERETINGRSIFLLLLLRGLRLHRPTTTLLLCCN